ncbi:hypothetical protein Droror1_Dr00025501 [Drosera rotundifolia]
MKMRKRRINQLSIDDRFNVGASRVWLIEQAMGEICGVDFGFEMRAAVTAEEMVCAGEGELRRGFEETLATGTATV